MTKFVANAGLTAASMALMAANYWYSFGLWPKSWTSLIVCSFGFVVITALRMAVESDK